MSKIVLLELARLTQGKSARDIAREAHIRPDTLSRIVNRRRRPSLDVAQRIAGALGLPVEAVFGPEDVRR